MSRMRLLSAQRFREVKSDPPISLALILLSIFVSNTRAATSSERSVSPSGQFIIYGGAADSRGAFSALSERTKSNLLAVLKRRDDWKIPIVVNLRSRAANLPELPAAQFRFSQTESGLKLQIDLTLSQDMNAAAIECQLARVILLEMIYRNQTGIASGDLYVDPPSWLVDGLLASLPNRSRTAFAAALSVSQRDVSLAEFLGRRPESLDSAAENFTAVTRSSSSNRSWNLQIAACDSVVTSTIWHSHQMIRWLIYGWRFPKSETGRRSGNQKSRR